MKTCSIGSLAKTLELKTDTIRYYERIGLVSNPTRLENGYRNYSQETKNRLLFIKWAKAMGFTLKEIKEMLNIKYASLDTCETIKNQAKSKLSVLDKKIAELKQLRKSLKKIISSCEETPGNDCPVLEEFK